MKSSILKELQRIELAIRGIDPLADIAELEAAQSDMQALIVALQAADTSLQSQISGNDTDISGHNSRISALEVLGGGSGIEGYIYAADVKPQGVGGGTFTAGAWRTRTLNTLGTDLAGVTLSVNTISGIPAGEYALFLRCPTYAVNRHAARLNTSLEIYPASAGYTVGSAIDSSELRRIILLSSTATATVEHRCSTTRSENGFGIDSNFGAEVYTELLLLKIG